MHYDLAPLCLAARRLRVTRACLAFILTMATCRTAMPATRALLLVGLAGEETVAQRQSKEVASWRELLTAQGVGEEFINVIASEGGLAEDVPVAGTLLEVERSSLAPRSMRDAVIALLKEWKSTTTSEDDIIVVLIGLGTVRDDAYQFQIKGPRLTGEDLKAHLAGTARSYLIIATGPGGSALGDALAGGNRMIITATSDANQINQTQFGVFWAEAAREIPQAGILELLQLTDQKLAMFYRNANLVQTETAALRIGDRAPLTSPFAVPLPKALMARWTFGQPFVPVSPSLVSGRNKAGSPDALTPTTANASERMD